MENYGIKKIPTTSNAVGSMGINKSETFIFYFTPLFCDTFFIWLDILHKKQVLEYLFRPPLDRQYAF